MIEIAYKKKNIKMRSIWYSDTFIDSTSKRDIDIYHDCKNKFGLASIHTSLISDLKPEEDSLFLNISKKFRYEIRKSQTRDFLIKHYESKDLLDDPNILNNFEEEYDIFTKDKGIKNTYNKNAMIEYMKKDAIVLSLVYTGDIIFAQHIYVVNEDKTRLLYSVSNFRRDNLDSKDVGMANKRLHWEDFVYFKNLEYKLYDWGGVSSFETPNGIDRFKTKFGGEAIEYTINLVGVSLLGKLIVFIKRWR